MEGSEVDRGPNSAVKDVHPNPRVMCRVDLTGWRRWM